MVYTRFVILADSGHTDTQEKHLVLQGFQHDIAAGDSVALTGPRTCTLRDLLSDDRISYRSFIHSRWCSSFNAGLSHSWIGVVHPFEGSCKSPHMLREIWRGMRRAIAFMVAYRGVRHSRRRQEGSRSAGQSAGTRTPRS